jgi:transposase-like protein
LEEVFMRIQGTQHNLQNVVDQEGRVLDILLHELRDGKTAKSFFSRRSVGVLISGKVTAFNGSPSTDRQQVT